MRVIFCLATAAAVLANAPFANSSPLYNTPVEQPVALRPSMSPFEPPAPLSPWSGFTVGVNLGGAWAGSDAAQVGVLPSGPFADPAISTVLTSNLNSRVGGFIGGAQVGYSQRLWNGLVLGFEADFQGMTGKSTGTKTGAVADTFLPGNTDVGSVNFSKAINYFGTVRARAGYEIAPNILAYLTGGLAYGQTSISSNSSVLWLSSAIVPGPGVAVGPTQGATSFTNYSTLRTGWTLGGGVEFPVWTNLTAKIEYLYYDLGWIYAKAPFFNNFGNQPGTLGTNIVTQTNAHFNGNIARVGLNYHFNFSPSAIAPISAKF
jgi:outer membrane immunogenic protein